MATYGHGKWSAWIGSGGWVKGGGGRREKDDGRGRSGRGTHGFGILRPTPLVLPPLFLHHRICNLHKHGKIRKI